MSRSRRFPLGGFLIILGCQFLGIAIAALAPLPLPGTVIGMLIFFAYLQWQRPGPEAGSVRAADGLLANLQLFFIPPGAGIITHLAMVRNEWLPMLGGFLASWVAAALVTGLTAAVLLRLGRKRVA